MDAHEPEQLDPRTAMELVTDTRVRTGRALDVNNAVLYGVWGMAWVVGYLGIWLSVRGHSVYQAPSTWAFVVLGVGMVVALAVTAVTIGRAVRGVTGLSATSGTMYGWAWFISFACLYAINAGLGRAGASDAVIGLFASAGPVLVVSIMYLAGGALWRNTTMFVVGAWLALVNVVAVLVGVESFGLLMAIAGGGGFLVAALHEARRRRP
jgi:hypothetical protein